MIRFDQVSKQFPDGTRAVDSLDLDIREGEFFVLIGPSGCGKTTTLKMINRLIDLTKGTVWINGKRISDYNIHELRWNIGYVLQQIALFPHMTIAENIAVVPELIGWSKEKITSRVDELLAMVGLEPAAYRQRKPSELSGGQQQRVGVIRALAADPEILIMDEPFSALDPFSREKLQDDLLEIQRKIKKTIVFVTHDMQEAMKLGDRVCLMNQGNVVQVGTPFELINEPVNSFVSDFVGGHHKQVDIMEWVSPLTENVSSWSAKDAVPANTPPYDILERLTRVSVVPVEQNGKVVGLIRKESVLEHLANDFKEKRLHV
ncbi:ABC transporter ATP-binding protein [Paenibacillus kribbensis]|uniref:ABC transporter ATP-binding protein n=1 Tax=Paenibacillus kribbensis TaxID=172713 RepID=UPI0008398E66|nr:ABC transporter ATP-binding protein [Paenibacillus kribbensis]